MAEVHRPLPAPAAERRAEVGAAAGVASLPARMIADLLARVRAEPVLVGLLAFAGLFFLYRWGIDLRRPWGDDHEGWRGYVDQGYYLREARELADLDLIPRDIFFYGPGYPALAAPFAGIGPYGWPFQDPFLPANTAVWLLTVAATYLAGRRLLGEWVGVTAALALVLATPLVRFVTVPWNSTVSMGAVALTVLVALQPRLRVREGVLLGLAVGFAYASRYVDALWVGIVVAAILAARLPLSLARARVVAGLIVGALIPLVPTFALQWRAFGDPFLATYTFHRNVGVDDFAVANIPGHTLQAFVSPWFFSDEPTKATPLLSTMFLLVLAPAGAWLLFRASSGPRRTMMLGYALASGAATVFYLAYYFTGSDGLQYGSLHFFKMWFPIWTLAAVAGVAMLVSRAEARSEAPRGPAPSG